MKGGGTGKLSLRWAGALLVIVTELVLTAALLLRKDADDVPAFERLERSTGVLDDVEARCNTQPVGGGPATVTFCGLDLVFGGSVGTVTYPYGRLSYSKLMSKRTLFLLIRDAQRDHAVGVRPGCDRASASPVMVRTIELYDRKGNLVASARARSSA